MAEMETCVLCNTEIDHIQGIRDMDAYRADCPVCGRYILDGTKSEELQQMSKDDKAMLSAYVREVNEFGPGECDLSGFDEDQINNIIEQYKKKSLEDKLNNFIRYLMKKTEYFGQEITIDFNIDYPITFSTNPDEFSNIFDAVKDMGFIECRIIVGGVQYPTLSIAGWEKYEEIKQAGPLSNKCFVAMSCSDDLRDAYDNGIKKAVEEAGYQPIFIERKEHNEKICDLIIANIRECKFLVADVTGQRQNVYYEAGFAHGLDRQVIWTCKKDDIKNAHFDTRQYNHILWENAEDLRKKLLNRIKATILLINYMSS